MSAINAIIESLKHKTALGNSKRRMKHLASDLLHATGEKPSALANGTFLSTNTIERVLDCPDEYSPNSDTIERIFRYCNAQVVVEFETIKPRFQNQPKVEKETEK